MKRLYTSIACFLLFGTLCAQDVAYVVRDNDNYYVSTDGEQLIKVQPYDIDKTLRNIPKEKLPAFLRVGSIRPSKMDNGDYALRAHVHGPGGGAWGAWTGIWVGKIGTHLAAQAIIVSVASGAAALSGPAAPATFTAVYGGLTSATAPVVESTSIAVAAGAGIFGAVATGPI